ncbi:MAG TPA: hypothetical protein VGC96_06155 [Candidatus Elarobacter sp.]|jgi:hypothetical protein
MKKSVLAAAFTCAALAMPVLALADDAMGGSKMATMVCRAAAANEKPTAMMMGAKSGLVCKTISPEKMMKKGSGPDLSHALSADQVDAAWREFLQQAVTIPGGTGGG